MNEVFGHEPSSRGFAIISAAASIKSASSPVMAAASVSSAAFSLAMNFW